MTSINEGTSKVANELFFVPDFMSIWVISEEIVQKVSDPVSLLFLLLLIILLDA